MSSAASEPLGIEALQDSFFLENVNLSPRKRQSTPHNWEGNFFALRQSSFNIPRPDFGDATQQGEGTQLYGRTLHIMRQSVFRRELKNELPRAELSYCGIEPDENMDLMQAELQKVGLSIENQAQSTADDDNAIFQVLGAQLGKTSLFLQSFAESEVSRSPSDSLLAQLSRSCKLFGYLQTTGCKFATQILLFFLENQCLRFVRWPMNESETMEPFKRKILVAWTAWRRFSLLRRTNSGTEFAELETRLKLNELSVCWMPPKRVHCPPLAVRSANEDSLSDLALVLPVLGSSARLSLSEKQIAWEFVRQNIARARDVLGEFFLSAPPARASRRPNKVEVPKESKTAKRVPETKEEETIQITSCSSTNKGLQAEAGKSTLFCRSLTMTQPKERCRAFHETLVLKNTASERIKVRVEMFSERCFVGCTKPRSVFNPAETSEILFHVVGLTEGVARALILFTIEGCKTTKRSHRMLAFEFGVSKCHKDEFWDIDLSHLVYNQRSMLGEGSSSIVYMATYLGVPVACKEFKQLVPNFPALKNKSAPPDSRSFARECKVLNMGKIEHPNIIRYLGASKRVPQRILIERLSCSLSQWLQRNTGDSLELKKKRVRIAIDVLNGLKFLHDQGLIHRDLKSPNILLDELGCAKIGDLGMAELVAEARARAAGTSSGASPTPRPAHSEPISRAGSLPWMAPELRLSPTKSPRKVSFDDSRLYFASDMYSFGVLLFEIWSGTCLIQHLSAPAKTVNPSLPTPQPSENFVEALLSQRHIEVGSLDSRVFALIRACCTDRPEHRIGTAMALDNLNEILCEIESRC